MLWGVFSDIHSNYGALAAVFDFYRAEKIGNFICCGDVVGYGPDPEKCLRFMSSLDNLTVVMGNHDALAAGRMESRWFKSEAVKAIDLNRKEISPAMMDFLAGMKERLVKTRPLRLKQAAGKRERRTDSTEGEKTSADGFTLVHASPRSHLREYLLSREQFLENLEYWSVSPCFFGHSHVPVFFEYDAASKVLTAHDPSQVPAIRLKKGRVYMLNPGSVGQPRDSNPMASCGVYDDERGIFEIHRVKYDILETQKQMEKKSYPKIFINRLNFGL